MKNIFTSIFNRIREKSVSILSNFYDIRLVRKFYWNLRAPELLTKWGDDKLDFEALESVIYETNAKRILDIGAGTGRLLELYTKIDGLNITAQDISAKALELMKERNIRYKQNVQYLNCNINDVSEHFDMVLSNRVLAAIPPKEISNVVKHFRQIAKYVYINEPIKSDGSIDSKYWFIHDYDMLLNANGFTKIKSGKISRMIYSLWKSNSL